MQIETCIPSKIVAIGPEDPSFVTSMVKNLLVKRNKLRRRGRIEEANAPALKINDIIAQNRSNRFVKL
jgi:hypothetical protein